MKKSLMIGLVMTSFLMIACGNSDAEFSQGGELAKLEGADLSSELVQSTEPTQEQVEEVIVQMENEMGEDMPIESVTQIIEKEDFMETYACKKGKKKRQAKNAETRKAKKGKQRGAKKESELLSEDSESLNNENMQFVENEKVKEIEGKIRKCKRKQMQVTSLQSKRQLKALMTTLLKYKKQLLEKNEGQSTKRNMASVKSEKKYMICHLPSGDETKAKTLILSKSAIKAHIKGAGKTGSKGYMGPCR